MNTDIKLETVINLNRPPLSLLLWWEEDWARTESTQTSLSMYMARRGYAYGGEKQLEACCEFLKFNGHAEMADELRRSQNQHG
jgi:hypothetical protein